MWYSGERCEFQMTLAQARSASHSGDCESDVRALLTVPRILRQLDRLGPDAIRYELKGYGAWDEEELADNEMNRVRFVWVAAGQIVDERNSR